MEVNKHCRSPISPGGLCLVRYRIIMYIYRKPETRYFLHEVTNCEIKPVSEDTCWLIINIITNIGGSKVINESTSLFQCLNNSVIV